MNGNSNNLIIGSYFSEIFIDPKKQIFVPKNDFNVIKNFYSKKKPFKWNSCDIRIFHDGLSKDFISRYSKKWIKFIYYDSLKHNMSQKDTLLLIALNFIKENPQWENIFILDTIKVKCITNPFYQIIDNPKCIFLANNEKKLANNTMFTSKLENINQFIKPNCLMDRPELNCDIMGGTRNMVIPFLEKIKDLLIQLSNSFNESEFGNFSIIDNSIAINFASLSQDNILTDKPLFASNKYYQINGNINDTLMFTYK